MPGEKKNKILYVITKSGLGGAQRYVLDLATNLPRDEYEVGVVLGGHGPLETALQNAGIKTFPLDKLGRDIDPIEDFSVLFELISLFEKEQPDVVHLNSSKIGLLGAIAARRAKIKEIIFTAHGWAFNEERIPLSRIIFGVLHWLTIILSTKTIAVAEATREQMAHWPGVKSKLVTIHNGLGPINFLDREEARKILFADLPVNLENKTVVGTVSELHKNKGLDYLIKAFAEADLKNAVLTIVSGGEEKKNLERLIAEKKLGDKVFLLGQIPDAKKYLKAFDIFTLTSRTEAFPYALLEAGLAGRPIVASKVGGIPEIIPSPEFGILVERGNINQIREALDNLIGNEALRIQLGQSLQKRVIENFPLRKVVAETTSIYKN